MKIKRAREGEDSTLLYSLSAQPKVVLQGAMRSMLSVSTRSLSRRFFATASHEPPKKIYGVPGRYASALYVSASKANVLPQVEAEVTAFSELINKNDGFSVYLKNPTISRSEKSNKMSEILDNKFSSVTRNFFLTMAANGKLGDSEKIIGYFIELMQASKGCVVVTVTSAEPLKKKALDSVQAAVVALIPKGGSVEFKTRVNESILGGLQVQIGDKFLDLSLANRIQQVSAELDALSV